MKDPVQAEFEFIYNKFNSTLFDDELDIPMFQFKDVQHSILCNDIKIQNRNEYHPRITMPFSSLYLGIEYFSAEIFNIMILQYGINHGMKLASNGDKYKNRRYRDLVKSLGFDCEKDTYETRSGCKYGYFIKVDKTFKDFCKINKFEKKWGNVYVSQKYKPTEKWDRNMNINSVMKHNTKNNIRKYIDAHGNSIRATKNHILFCFDNYPDIADEIEARYGIKRMETDFVNVLDL